jgi:DNA-binding NarL/FixJ family response regulator
VASNPSSIRILLIDSQQEERKYWAQRLTLSSPDLRVLEAVTGAAGLSICRSERVDCVISELSLPDMSGFEVLTTLVPHARRPDMAVIMLTNLTLSEMATFALNSGAQAYLIKSHISGDDLDEAVHKAIARVRPEKHQPKNL